MNRMKPKAQTQTQTQPPPKLKSKPSNHHHPTPYKKNIILTTIAITAIATQTICNFSSNITPLVVSAFTIHSATINSHNAAFMVASIAKHCSSKRNYYRKNRNTKGDLFVCLYSSEDRNSEDQDHDGYNYNSTDSSSSLSVSSTELKTSFYQDHECFDFCFVEEVEGEQQQQQPPNSNQNKELVTKLPNTKQASENTPPSTKEPTKKTWQNLELRWSIDENSAECDLEDISSCSEPCPDCHGTGKHLCSFCGGVGYIDFGYAEKGTVGERIQKNTGEKGSRLGTECPVCNEDGEQTCQTCRGSGWIAKWRLHDNMRDLHP